MSAFIDVDPTRLTCARDDPVELFTF